MNAPTTARESAQAGDVLALVQRLAAALPPMTAAEAALYADLFAAVEKSIRGAHR